MLSDFRVLDLTDEQGFFCGRILGDLGADVIKIEPPGGDLSRSRGPFYHNEQEPEKSLYWFAYNANKKGITLNLEVEEGREIFKRLVQSADFIIESFPPGYLESMDIGYSTLEAVNPRIIVVSITPFGQTGPYKDYKGSDITCMAMGGFMHFTGEPDGAPLRISAPQAYLHAGAAAAVGAMIAHYHRQVAGFGQHIDVSIQESVISAILNMHIFWDASGKNIRRQGTSRVMGSGAKQQLIWSCKDGHVAFALFGGRAGAETNRRLVQWMDNEGLAKNFLKTKNWDSFDYSIVSQEELDRISEPIRKFFSMHTREELWAGARERRIMLYPVSTSEDLLHDPQLQSRVFWETVEHPELNCSVIYPSPFLKSTNYQSKIYRRAPLIGEHNEEVYEGKLGLSKQDMEILKQIRAI